MVEIFKENKRFDIPGKEGYQIGYFDGKREVKALERKRRHYKGGLSNHKEKILKQNRSHGYLRCCIGNLHILVAKTFIVNDNKKQCVLHKNDIKSDNKIENLYRGTYSDNNKDAYRNGRINAIKGKFGKLNKRSKRVGQYDLQGNLIKERDCMSDICRELGCSGGNIHGVCNGKYGRNTIKGFIWKYL